MPLTNRVILFGFFAVYFSYILFYDLRILNARFGISVPELRFMLQVWGVALAPFLLVFLASIRLSPAVSLFIIAFLIFFLNGVFVALINENSLRNLTSTAYKSLFIPAGVGFFLLYRRHIPSIERGILLVGGFYVFLRTSIFILFFGSFTNLYYGTSLDALVLCVALKRLFSNYIQNGKSSWGSILKLLVVPGVLLGQKRTVLVAFLIYLFHRHVRVFFSIAISVVAVLFVLGDLDWRNLPLLGRFFALSDVDFIVNNQMQRFVEVGAAYEAWTSSYASFVFGHGFGAELLVYTGRDDYLESLHSLHNTPMAVIYRSGVFGILYIGVILFIALRSLFSRNLEMRAVSAIIIALFGASFFFYSFIDEIFIGFFMAYLLISSSQRESKE